VTNLERALQRREIVFSIRESVDLCCQPMKFLNNKKKDLAEKL